VGRNSNRHVKGKNAKVVRAISKSKYLVAAIITAGIFFLGLALGLVIDDERLNFILEQEKLQELEYTSLQLLYNYMDQLGEQKDCELLSTTFEIGLDNLEKSRLRLVKYSEDAKINKKEFEILQREYLQSMINYWLLSQKVKSMCDLELVPIMYFFSTEKECPDCGSQEFVLSYMKKTFGLDVLIFSIDSTYEGEPMIPLLMRNHKISQYPTLIINEEKYEGLKNKDEILEAICEDLGEKYEECDSIGKKSGVQILTNET